MPKERDRREFRRQMAELEAIASGSKGDSRGPSLLHWIEKVKDSTWTSPGDPGDGPSPITISETFLESTGFKTVYQDELVRAAQRATRQCDEWRKRVIASSAGTSRYAQCSGPSRRRT